MTRKQVYRKWLVEMDSVKSNKLHKVIRYMDDVDRKVRDNVPLDMLPRGSGINGSWRWHIEFKRTSMYHYAINKLVLTNFWHCLNERGFYDGFINFSVVIPIVGNTAMCDDFQLIAHDWKRYTTKKYWPLVSDYIAECITLSLPKSFVLLVPDREVTK